MPFKIKFNLKLVLFVSDDASNLFLGDLEGCLIAVLVVTCTYQH